MSLFLFSIINRAIQGLTHSYKQNRNCAMLANFKNMAKTQFADEPEKAKVYGCAINYAFALDNAGVTFSKASFKEQMTSHCTGEVEPPSKLATDQNMLFLSMAGFGIKLEALEQESPAPAPATAPTAAAPPAPAAYTAPCCSASADAISKCPAGAETKTAGGSILQVLPGCRPQNRRLLAPGSMKDDALMFDFFFKIIYNEEILA